MTTLHIAHLYPRELGINGDVGNVMTLAFRARACGVDVHVTDVHRGESLPSDIDLVHVGSGPADALKLVLPDIQRHRESLISLRDSGVPFLGISAGWFALSDSVTFVDGATVAGAGVFPTRVTLVASRAVGEIEILTPWGSVTGFENHSSHVDDAGLEHFGSVLHGMGSDPTVSQGHRWDGVLMGNSLGTNLHGPLLPMNPDIADSLILSAVARRNPSWTISNRTSLGQIDEFARLSRDAVRSRL
jgi:CobQ-like glutamine amidotransferase family enzyme